MLDGPIVDIETDRELLGRIVVAPTCPDSERLWARAAIERLGNHSVRGAVCAIQLTGINEDPLGVEFENRVKQFPCLLCETALLNGDSVMIWTTIHAIHRRCLEGGLDFDGIPRDLDVPEPISRVRDKGRLGS